MDNGQSNINKARPLWIQIVTLAPPTLKDNTADADRVLNALKSRLNSEAIHIDLELNVNQEFMNRFSAAKFLPHTDPARFPSVKPKNLTMDL